MTFSLLICFAAFIQSGICNSLLVNKIQDGVRLYKGCSLKEKGTATLIPDTTGVGGSLQVLPSNAGGLYTNSIYGTYPTYGGYYGYGKYAPNTGYNYANYQTQPQYIQPQNGGYQGGNVIYMDSNSQGYPYGGATSELIGGVNYGQGGLVSQTYPYYGYGQGVSSVQSGGAATTELIGDVNYGQGGLVPQTYPYYNYDQGTSGSLGTYGTYGTYGNHIQNPNPQVQYYSGWR